MYSLAVVSGRECRGASGCLSPIPSLHRSLELPVVHRSADIPGRRCSRGLRRVSDLGTRSAHGPTGDWASADSVASIAPLFGTAGFRRISVSA